jgi:ECF transporter S component (folate family)
MNKIKKILIRAILLATCIVLGRFLAIKTPIISISFYFVPLIFSAIILGPKYSALIGMLSDLIGALMFPTGAYFPGFTLSGLLTGIIYGVFLYQKDKIVINKKFLIKLIISVLLVCFIINGCLNTVWVIMIVKSAANIVVPIRILKQLIMVPIIVITIYLLSKILANKINSYLEA